MNRRVVGRLKVGYQRWSKRMSSCTRFKTGLGVSRQQKKTNTSRAEQRISQEILPALDVVLPRTVVEVVIP